MGKSSVESHWIFEWYEKKVTMVEWSIQIRADRERRYRY